MDKDVLKAEKVLELGFVKIAESGEEYVKKTLKQSLEERGLTKTSILNDWWISLKFIFSRSFFQGRSDKLSGKFEKISVAILEDWLGKDSKEILLNLKKLESENNLDLLLLKKKNKVEKMYEELINKNSILKKLEEDFPKKILNGKSYLGRKRDKLMVLHLLIFSYKLGKKPIVSYLKEKIEMGKIEDAYNELKQIISVGSKISSFILRDIVLLYDLENIISENDILFIQPIDTYLERLALALMNISIKEKDVSAAKFNAGAWYISSRQSEKE